MFLKHFFFAIGVFTALGYALWSPAHLDTARAGEGSLKESVVPGTAPDQSRFEPDEPTGVITLRDAISAALFGNPELKAFSLEIRAKEARALQEGLIPNPEIEIEAENFGGSGGFSSFDFAETTIQLSQLVELGAKRAKRKKVASLEHHLAEWDYKSKRADVLTEVTKSFVEVLASQERLALAEELAGLAERVLDTVSARVKAGKVSPIEATRAGVTFSTSQIALGRAKRKLEASRKQLAATWGEKTPYFIKVDGQLDVIAPIPSTAQIENLISQNPDIARWVTEMEQRQASVALEEARRIPDPTISLGARHFNEIDDNAFVLAFSIPIPVFDQNQGGTLEARQRLAKADRERQAARMRIYYDLAEAYQSLSSAYSEATALKNEVLPGAQAVFHASGEGYRQGKFDYLVLLDAQRTLFDVTSQYVEALTLYHKAVADVERLIGTGLDGLTRASRQE